MSRRPRAGEAAGKVTIRATDAERELWQAAADMGGAPTLSDALRPAITAWAVGVVEIKLPPGKRKTRLLAVAISGEPAEVTPKALTREMIAELLVVADVRVATDCQALLLGHGGKAKLGLMRERVASAYNRLRLIDARGATP